MSHHSGLRPVNFHIPAGRERPPCRTKVPTLGALGLYRCVRPYRTLEGMNTCLRSGSVVVGVDGSLSSETAVRWAASFAHMERQPLAIVYASGIPAQTAADLDTLQTQPDPTPAAGVLNRAGALATRTRPGLEVSLHVELGSPQSVLLGLAKDASVLVVGTRGRSSMAGLLLGSVSVALTAHAPCPVVVARSSFDLTPIDDLPVIVGADGSAAAAEALTFAYAVAAKQNRPLHILHAVSDAWLFSIPSMLSPEATLRALALDHMMYPDVVVHPRLVAESPARALVNASEQAALVVVGSRGRGTTSSRLLGSVSRSVVERSHCTVVVVPPTPPGTEGLWMGVHEQIQVGSDPS